MLFLRYGNNLIYALPKEALLILLETSLYIKTFAILSTTCRLSLDLLYSWIDIFLQFSERMGFQHDWRAHCKASTFWTMDRMVDSLKRSEIIRYKRFNFSLFKSVMKRFVTYLKEGSKEVCCHTKRDVLCNVMLDARCTWY